MKRPAGKLLGIAAGERSWQIAEIIAGRVKLTIEFALPSGSPEQIGAALSAVLREHGLTARQAVVGLPARWLASKSKDVPPADTATLSELLRLAVETDFPGDLGELSSDYVAGDGTVLLLATPRKHVEQIAGVCAAAKIKLQAVTATALELGRAAAKDAIAIAVTPAGAELAASPGGVPTAIRHLRSAAGEKAFVGELRRAIATLPSNGQAPAIVLWDSTGLNADTVANALGLSVSRGAADVSPAAAVALHGPSVDFLHSRLAAAPAARFPKWARYAALVTVLAVALGYFAYDDLHRKERQLAALRSSVAQQQAPVKSAEAFVGTVTFARQWMNADPRYVAAVRDLTAGMPAGDEQTYATNLSIREQTQPAAGGRQTPTGLLVGTLAGKTADQQRVQSVVDSLRKVRAFREVKLGGTQDAGRSREVSFTIQFVFDPNPARAQ